MSVQTTYHRVDGIKVPFAGKGYSDAASSAKHVLSELKALHLSDVDTERLKNASAREKIKLIPRHQLDDVGSVTDAIDIQRPLDQSTGSSLPRSALYAIRSGDDFPALTDSSRAVASKLPSEPGSAFNALLELRESVDQIGEPELPTMDAIQTVSQVLTASDSCTTKVSRQNGWTVFWKEKEKTSERFPGETTADRRNRILAAAKHEWNVTLLQIGTFDIGELWYDSV